MDNGVVEGSCPSLALGAESCTAEALGAAQDALRVEGIHLVPRLTRRSGGLHQRGTRPRATPNARLLFLTYNVPIIDDP
jgi:hypothetical protein